MHSFSFCATLLISLLKKEVRNKETEDQCTNKNSWNKNKSLEHQEVFEQEERVAWNKGDKPASI